MIYDIISLNMIVSHRAARTMNRSEIPPELKSIGQYLQLARRQRGLSQTALANQTGIDQTRISRIEQRKELPTLIQTFELARALAVSLQRLINGRDESGATPQELAIELYDLGVKDLLLSKAIVPGACRATELVLALAVRGNQPEPRIIEAIPVVLSWNKWSPHVLTDFCQKIDDHRVRDRLAWLAEVTLTIDRTYGFPGGCLQTQELEAFLRMWPSPRSSQVDDLGHPGDDATVPPVSKRWKINYPAQLSDFHERAKNLLTLRFGIPP
jgi:transcriptional regulator with XRE-family HTH domain